MYNLDVLLFLFGTSLLFHVKSNCCFFTCIQISQEAGQVVWYSHLLKNFPQFVVIHTFQGFGILNKAEVDVFLELLAFLMIQRILAIWSLVLCLIKIQFEHLEVHSSCTVKSWLREFSSLLWYCLSLGLEWKLSFSSPVATVNLSIRKEMLSTLLKKRIGSWHFLFFTWQNTMNSKNADGIRTEKRDC